MDFYTADICDAKGDEIEVLEPIFKSYGGLVKCYGTIKTIELDEDNSGLIELLKERVTDKIAVVDVKGDKCAVVGENLMNLAYKNGWKAIVVHGFIRDIHATQKTKVGLFALGVYPKKSQKKAEAKRDIELNFAGVTLKPNMHLYADLDGIIISKSRVD
jgi:regulator of ribonuclease activity A